MNGATGLALDTSAEQTPDSAWAAQNGLDGLAGCKVAQDLFFPVIQSVQHRWYIV